MGAATAADALEEDASDFMDESENADSENADSEKERETTREVEVQQQQQQPEQQQPEQQQQQPQWPANESGTPLASHRYKPRERRAILLLNEGASVAAAAALTTLAAEAEAAEAVAPADEVSAVDQARTSEEAAAAEEARAAAAAEAAAEEAARQLAEAAAAERARQELFESEGVVCDDEWERLELRCVLSFQRLTDPAKGSACNHRACCNYKELRDYVGRLASGPKQCPLATCGARLQRTRDVERDAPMLELLQTVRADVATVWLRDGELRTSDPRARPPPTEGGSVASRKRSSTAASTGVEPRRSTRRNVIVL